MSPRRVAETHLRSLHANGSLDWRQRTASAQAVLSVHWLVARIRSQPRLGHRGCAGAQSELVSLTSREDSGDSPRHRVVVEGRPPPRATTHAFTHARTTYCNS